MKKIASFFLSIVFILSVFAGTPVVANATTNSPLTFELNEDSKSYAVIDCDNNASGEIIIPEKYNRLPVTVIGINAFSECENITSIVMPNSITKIDAFAFTYCISLQSIKLSDNIEEVLPANFLGCDSLSSVIASEKNVFHSTVDGVLFNKNKTELILFPAGKKVDLYSIPQGVSSIGKFAFIGCTGVKSISLPSSITKITDAAFSMCSSIEKVIFPNTVTYIGQSAFSMCENLSSITLPNSVINIDSQAFYHCTSLKSVVLNNGLIYINSQAFSDCIALSEINIPDSVTYIGPKTFYNTALYNYKNYWYNNGFYVDDCLFYVSNNAKGEYSIKNGTRLVATSAFADCTSLTSVIIPQTAKDILYSFGGCPSLKTIIVDKSNPFFMSENGIVYNKTKTEIIVYPEGISGELIIPNGVEFIGDDCFEGCNNITSVVIPGSVTYIGEDAFEDCANLKSVDIRDGVKYIDWGAFSSCTSLETVTIPQSITDIGAFAFIDCDNLKTVNYKGSKTQWEKVNVDSSSFNFGDVEVIFVNSTALSTPSVKTTNTAKGVKVSWNKVENAQSYIIYRRTYNASTKKYSGWTVLNKAFVGTSYTDTSVKLGTTYSYTVRAANKDSTSKYVATKGIKYNVTPTVKVANASNGVKVAWSKVANATGYTVYSSTYNTKTKKWSGWKNRGATKAGTTSWVDKNATKSGIYYKYTVRACNGSIKGSYNQNGVKTYYLAQPTVKIANNASGIKVTWNKIAGAKGYIVYRQELVNGKWTSWKTLGTINKGTIISWIDKTVKSGTQYRYTVRAFNGNYKSTYKATSGLLYLAQPKVTVKAVTNGINVGWSQSTGATGYAVYRMEYNAKTKKWTGWKKIGTAKKTVKSWTDKSAKKGVTYRYTVRAVNGKVASTYKASANIKR